MKNVIFFMCFFLVSACAMTELTTFEQGAVMSKQTGEAYLKIHNKHIELKEALTKELAIVEPDQILAIEKNLEQLDKAAIVLNKARKALISYNKVLIAWAEAGKETPTPKDFWENKNLFDSLIAEATLLLTFL